MLKKNWKILIFLAVLVFAVYGNSLPNSFISDDVEISNDLPKWTWQNVAFPPYTALRRIIYAGLYPLVGIHPEAYRTISIVFHTINTWLVFGLVGLIAGSLPAFFTAALVAVHPIFSESVAWISGGVYPQYTMFVLTTLLLYSLVQRKWNRRLYGISLITSMLALFSSEKALAIIPILILTELSFGNLKRNWRRLVPFMILGLFSLALTLSTLGWRNEHVQSVFLTTPAIRNPLVQIPTAVTTYLALLVWPIPLSLYHPDPAPNLVNELIRLIVFILFVLIIIVSFRKDRRIFFFLSFFLLALAPTFVPVQLSWTVAERYAYLGAIGLIAAVASFSRTLLAKLQGESLNKFNVSLLFVLLIFLSTRTIIRNRDWYNEISFWSATAKTAPNLPNVHSNLAVALGQKGDYQGAIKEFQITIALKPDWVDPYYNLGLTFQRAGQFSSAVTSYHKALSLNPSLWQPYRNLAEIAFSEKRYDDAIGFLNQAIEKNPTNANLFVNLALVYQAKGDRKKALAAVTEALAIEPANEAARSLFQDLTSPSTQR